jgi:hypothetical protein
MNLGKVTGQPLVESLANSTTLISSSSTVAQEVQLENTIEQAVFFDGVANPVSFSLQADSSALLEAAILAISDKIVTSST